MCRCSKLTHVGHQTHFIRSVCVLVPPTIGCALFLTVLFPENHVHATSTTHANGSVISKHVNKLKSCYEKYF